jgi:hypothetical protein
MKSSFLMSMYEYNANEHFWFPNGSEKFSKKEYDSFSKLCVNFAAQCINIIFKI